ncbi:MarR family winged helix-turn-helix transcriptional regulator [Brevibacterium oceani]|uniref:MarR family winged helix-turn-helix transcriptional regulator n=1 Tax=Brevibacterium oceani TaxID=358099 RepID=UPI0015E75CD6|nr:MarR family transcriptional regulator [Brevibacterium oceani]
MSEIAKSAVYDVDSSDPEQHLVDRSELSPEAIAQIGELMAAFGELREAERAMSEESQKYMQLNATDMRAIHYLIICRNQQRVGTPGGIAEHLGISASATTKLLDRLERGEHIVREPHPNDRRAQAISITTDTYTTAIETVGRAQSRRFHAAARLTSSEREVVIRFLRETKRDLTDPDFSQGDGSEQEVAEDPRT